MKFVDIKKDKNLNKNGNIFKNIFLEKYNLNKVEVKNKYTSKYKSNLLFKKLIFLLVMIFLIIVVIFYNSKIMNNDFDNVKNYMNLVLNGTNIDKGKIYYPSKNPKISIVIPVYNGEAFLNIAILSIQNQDFKDLEIIIVDDGSKDNSVKLIKEIMKREPRIFLYENGENKGAFYTKVKGILFSKGKYIMILDEDDIYVQRDAFRFLYEEAEKNNIDFLLFHARFSEVLNKRNGVFIRGKQKIIYQPELSNFMYHFDSYGRVKQNEGLLVNIFTRANLFKKVIKLIDEKNLNQFMFCHEDYILFFLLTRNAKNLEKISGLFYIILHTWNNSDSKVKYRNQFKIENLRNKQCFSYINFLDILFKNTKNNFKDKKIAFSQLEIWYLNNHCRGNIYSRKKAIQVFKLYLNCQYISKNDKRKIKKFIDEEVKI